MKKILTGSVLLLLLSGNLNAAQELSWVGCGITKKAFMSALAAGYEKQTGIKIDIQGGGATRGIREASEMKADIGGSCRYMIEGDTAEVGAFFEPLAWDALVVIVHKDNPVEDISLDQVHALYSGRIKNWKELGGPDKPIKLYARKGKISGVGRTIRKLVFANYDQEFAATKIFKSTGPLEKAIEEDVDAIGITGISSARKRNVKQLKLDGVAPTYENIKSGAYTLYRPLYVVYNKTNPHAREIEGFIRYAHSREGKQIIRENEVVPYADALALVMKQLDQESRARQMGLYR